jgi:hypothetical protein
MSSGWNLRLLLLLPLLLLPHLLHLLLVPLVLHHCRLRRLPVIATRLLLLVHLHMRLLLLLLLLLHLHLLLLLPSLLLHFPSNAYALLMRARVLGQQLVRAAHRLDQLRLQGHGARGRRCLPACIFPPILHFHCRLCNARFPQLASPHRGSCCLRVRVLLVARILIIFGEVIGRRRRSRWAASAENDAGHRRRARHCQRPVAWCLHVLRRHASTSQWVSLVNPRRLTCSAAECG